MFGREFYGIVGTFLIDWWDDFGDDLCLNKGLGDLSVKIDEIVGDSWENAGNW